MTHQPSMLIPLIVLNRMGQTTVSIDMADHNHYQRLLKLHNNYSEINNFAVHFKTKQSHLILR